MTTTINPIRTSTFVASAFSNEPMKVEWYDRSKEGKQPTMRIRLLIGSRVYTVFIRESDSIFKPMIVNVYSSYNVDDEYTEAIAGREMDVEKFDDVLSENLEYLYNLTYCEATCGVENISKLDGIDRLFCNYVGTNNDIMAVGEFFELNYSLSTDDPANFFNDELFVSVLRDIIERINSVKPVELIEKTLSEFI